MKCAEPSHALASRMRAMNEKLWMIEGGEKSGVGWGIFTFHLFGWRGPVEEDGGRCTPTLRRFEN